MSSDRAAFEAAIRNDPTDGVLRRIYSDYLEENGFSEEAKKQREWEKSRQWMRDFSKIHHAYGKFHNWEEEERTGKTEDGDDVAARIDEFFDEFMQFLHGHVVGEGYFHFDVPYEFKDYSEEMWDHYRIVTGEDPPMDVYRTKRPSSFRCAC